jgi:rhodanese-related sulfurtransferase
MKSLSELLAEANSRVDTISAGDAIQLRENPEIVFIDLRDSAELQREGMIPGAVHAARGMLEFLIDPSSPFHDPVFSSGKKLFFYCSGGGRSAFAASTALLMGLTRVSHIGGGLKAWREAGGPVEAVDNTLSFAPHRD